jgi:phospholipase/lecithinase/hemolysin
LEEFSENKISFDEVETVVGQAEPNTIKSVGSLVKLGAQSLLFYEVPDLGLAPRFASGLAASFNAAEPHSIRQPGRS